MSKLNRVAAAALLLAGIPLGAMAQLSQNVQVQVTVQGSCSVSAPANANFGTQVATAPASNLATPGQVTLTCNRGALPVLSVNNGLNFGGGSRRMANGGNFVSYAVKQPTISGTDFTVCPAPLAGTDWSTAANALDASASFAASGGPRTVRVCFQTTVDEDTPGAAPPAGTTFTDTVAVSVTF